MSKVMVVDDSEVQRAQLKSTLESGGYQVVEAVDGVNGLAVFDANSDVSVIICDVNMPNMDGISMVSHIHGSGKLGKVPVFMLTTETSPELKEKAKAIGVRAWVTKPFVPDKLLGAVNKVLGKA